MIDDKVIYLLDKAINSHTKNPDYIVEGRELGLGIFRDFFDNLGVSFGFKSFTFTDVLFDRLTITGNSIKALCKLKNQRSVPPNMFADICYSVASDFDGCIEGLRASVRYMTKMNKPPIESCTCTFVYQTFKMQITVDYHASSIRPALTTVVKITK